MERERAPRYPLTGAPLSHGLFNGWIKTVAPPIEEQVCSTRRGTEKKDHARPDSTLSVPRVEKVEKKVRREGTS